MKALVKVAFTDKTNMVDVYYPDDVFEGSEERVNELIGGGYVVAAETETAEEKPKQTRRRKAATKEG